MNRAFACVSILGLMGCADIRVPIAYTDGHLKEIKRAVSTPMRPEIEREKVTFHVDRGLAWTSAALEHKGAPPMPIQVPAGAYDTSTIYREDEVMEEYKADVEKEKAIRAVASNLWMKVTGGAGGVGIMAIIGQLMRVLKKKNRAIAEYDSAVESIPKAKRVELGKTRPDMTAAHSGLSG